MQARKLAQLPKVITDAGKWRCGETDAKGKMGKDAFPLARGRSFQLGKQWHWRVDRWKAGDLVGRLLVAYHLGKGNYLAYLSIERTPKEHTVVVCLEFHGDHDGWHIHSGSGAISDFATGCTRQRILGIRKPRKGSYHRVRRAADGTVIDGFAMSQLTAQNIAYQAFRIVDSGTEMEGLFG